VYRWTKPNNTTITSASTDSLTITLQFNTGYTGGSVTVKGQTACGAQGTAKSQAVTHTGCPTGTRSMAGAVETTGEVSAVIYPSPNDGNFTLVVNTGVQTTSNATVELVDMYGRVVARYSAVNNFGMINKSIRNTNLSDGMYTVRYTIGKTTGNTRMMIQH
jgi:hypothetical protein